VEQDRLLLTEGKDFRDTERQSMLTGRTVALVFAVAVLVLWFSTGDAPTWLVVAAAASAVVLGFQASVRQRRIERKWARALWASLRRS
jgi:membrane protein YdbS with pleckstrin-like domain